MLGTLLLYLDYVLIILLVRPEVFVGRGTIRVMTGQLRGKNFFHPCFLGIEPCTQCHSLNSTILRPLSNLFICIYNEFLRFQKMEWDAFGYYSRVPVIRNHLLIFHGPDLEGIKENGKNEGRIFWRTHVVMKTVSNRLLEGSLIRSLPIWKNNTGFATLRSIHTLIAFIVTLRAGTGDNHFETGDIPSREIRA